MDLQTGTHIGESHKKTPDLRGQVERTLSIENKLSRVEGGAFISLIVRLRVVFPQNMEEFNFFEGGDLGHDFVK